MIEQDEVLGIAHVPDGEEMRLVRHSDGFSILLRDTDLMSTVASASEEALATMTCARLGERADLQLLIGGYGMGYTLRAALDTLDDDAGIVVSEIAPEIIEWARGPMQSVTGNCLDDPRVTLVEDDVAVLIDAARGAYDGILLDVDNGPEGLTRRLNDYLYSKTGLGAAMTALRPGGILSVWSAEPEPRFTTRLEEVGFSVSEETVRARPNGKGFRHHIWFAQKR